MTDAVDDIAGKASAYKLDKQIGFLLRKANQRHTSIFANIMAGDITPMQFAAMAKLSELGEVTQNRLGRMVAIDAATIKGVVDRLTARGLVSTKSDPSDRRRIVVSLTREGMALLADTVPAALAITEETLSPLNADERKALTRLLLKLV